MMSVIGALTEIRGLIHGKPDGEEVRQPRCRIMLRQDFDIHPTDR
jgi:hypothetical protein